MGDQGDPRRRRRLDPARSGGWAKSEPMLARTAFGENGSAQSGPSTTGAAEQRVGGADDRADVAGVGDAVQVDAGRAGPLGPAQRPDRDHPRARAERRDLGQQLRLDLLAAEAAAGGGEHEARLGAGRQAGLDQVLALAREQALALAVLALAQLADQLQLLVLGAGDHRPVGLRFGFFFSWTQKKRAVFTARPGNWSVRCALGGRTLPG